MMFDDKSLMDLRAMFAGCAVSGYVRDSVSYASREDECKEVAIAALDIADALIEEMLRRYETSNSLEE